MLKRNTLKCAAILLAILMAVSMFPAVAFGAAEGEVILTIIHVNDRHGRMDADAYISQLKKDTVGNVLVLDAGDSTHGQTTTNLSEGSAMVELMNAVGYSAMVPGNHDFNFGVERLIELSQMMDFPLLAANVKKSDGENLLTPCAVFEMDGVTVGVFGLVTPEVPSVSDPRITQGLSFEDPTETAALMVETLKGEGCDIIIALTHLGLDIASKPEHRSDALAKVPGVDVVIDAHSHSLLEQGLEVSDTLIAQTGSHAANIGVVTFTQSGDVFEKKAELIAVPEDGVESDLPLDEDIIAKISALDAQNESVTSAIVGHTPVLLKGEREQVRTGETNLANLIADSLLYATHADCAFVTGGNIRASIEAGDITMGQVLTTLPFANLLMTVELTGADLLAVLEHGVSLYPEPAGQHIQVAGLSFTFDPEAEPGKRVLEVTMRDGSALDLDKVYTLATSEFLVAGGDGYEMMKNGKNPVYYQGDAEVLAEYLATSPVINAEPENRVFAINAKGDDF